MQIGVPKEVHRVEHRVGLSPFGVARLANRGHQVFVQTGAGTDSHFTDEDYRAVGGQIVFDPDEVYQRADLICRVGPLAGDEIERLRPTSIVCGFHHLAVAPKELVAALSEKSITLIGWELVENAGGNRPILVAFSEIGGRMAVHTAAHLLERGSGGRGVILGGVPGIPPATVVVLGAGTLGRTAAAQSVACGAHVIVLDADVERLRSVHECLDGHVATAIASERNLDRYSGFADVLIGAVLIPGGRAPYLVTEDMVKRMRTGSVILDLSIDQGGCVETSRPTRPDHPTYTTHDVIHYCVPNMTTNVPRTASRALTIGALPWVMELAAGGLETAVRGDPGLARGVYMFDGRVVNEAAAHALGVKHEEIARLLD
jgi:alanine dehydrogenase